MGLNPPVCGFGGVLQNALTDLHFSGTTRCYTFAMSTLPDRFWSMISPLPYTGCWIWTGSRYPVGYGKVHWQGKKRGAHRVVYELLVGPIPDGLVIDHLCRVRECVNPAHLEPVTFGENIRRGDAPSAVLGRAGYCKQGHKLGGDNVHPSVAARGGQDCRICGNARSNYWQGIYREQAKR